MTGLHPTRSTAAHLLLLGVVLVWGATFVLIKDALSDVSPLLFNFLRMGLAALLLTLLYRRHLRRLSREGWGLGVLAGMFLAAGYQLQTTGLARTTPSRSAFLTGLVVVFVPFLSLSPRLRSPGALRPAPVAFLGAAIGFAGLALLAIPAVEPLALRSFRSIGAGELLTIGCAFAFALHLLTLAHASLRVAFQALAAVQISTAAVIMAMCLPVFEPHPHFELSRRFLLAWLIAALLATAAAFSIQSWAQGFLPASHTALILALEPVFAAATSFLILGERLHGRSLAGAALVLAAIAISELFPASGLQATAHEAVPLRKAATIEASLLK
jgi:drug/metabolite transporter (DMT)-like permease